MKKFRLGTLGCPMVPIGGMFILHSPPFAFR